MLTCTTYNTILLIIAIKVYIYNIRSEYFQITKQSQIDCTKHMLYKRFGCLTNRLELLRKRVSTTGKKRVGDLGWKKFGKHL